MRYRCLTDVVPSELDYSAPDDSMKTLADSPAVLGSRHPAGGRVLHRRRRGADLVPALQAAEDADRRGRLARRRGAGRSPR